LKIVFVVDGWPHLSETFVVREIASVARRHDVRILALQRGEDGPLDPEARALSDRVRFLDEAPTTPLGLLRGSSSPLRWARALSAARGARAEGTLRRFAPLLAEARCLQAWGVDRIHAHFARWATAAAEVLSAWTGAPFGFTAHAYDLFVSPVRLPEKLRHASWVVSCTASGRDEVARAYGAELADRIHVIRHGLDLGIWTPAPPRPTTTTLHVLAVGRLVRKKGFDVLVAALADIVARGVDVDARIVGEGAESEGLRAAIERAGLGSRVALEGARLPAEVRTTMVEWADVLVAPSRVDPSGDRDGLPNVVGEAMASALPVVGTPVGGLPEMLEDDVTGLIVPPDDARSLAVALERLARDPALRLRLGADARRRAEAVFDADKNVAALLALVEAGRRHA